MGPLSIPTLRKDKKSQSKPTGVCGSNCSSSGSEAAQDPAGTSELVHTLEMWQFTPGKSMIQWVEGKKTYPKLTSFMNLSSTTQLTRVHEDWGKQYEEAERAHSPPLPIRRASNFQDTQMPRGRQGFAEGAKPLSVGRAPLKPSLFSGNASCPPELTSCYRQLPNT